MKTFAILLLTSSLLTGCSWLEPYQRPITQGNIMPKTLLQELQPGLTRDQVTALLGPEMGQNPFNPRHSEYIFYTTDPSFNQKVIHHLVLEFDEEGYLTQWQKAEPITLKPKSFLD